MRRALGRIVLSAQGGAIVDEDRDYSHLPYPWNELMPEMVAAVRRDIEDPPKDELD
jgi:hypothetical protein